MCSAPNAYMFVYTLIGAQIVPLAKCVLDKEYCSIIYVTKASDMLSWDFVKSRSVFAKCDKVTALH